MQSGAPPARGVKNAGASRATPDWTTGRGLGVLQLPYFFNPRLSLFSLLLRGGDAWLSQREGVRKMMDNIFRGGGGCCCAAGIMHPGSFTLDSSTWVSPFFWRRKSALGAEGFLRFNKLFLYCRR